jgi:gas vesicle protein
MNSGKVLFGVLAGAAAGVLLGVLFAPEKGSTTRKKISDTSNDYAGEVKDKFDDLLASINSKLEDVKLNIKDLSEKGRSKFEETKKSAMGEKYSQNS